MPLPDAEIHTGLDAIAADLDYGSLHTAYSSSGSNELSGGSYARLALSWGSAASTEVASNTAETFEVPSGNTVYYLGFWSALTSGTFRGMIPLGATKVLPCVGFDSDDYVYCDAHGFSDGDTVVVFGQLVDATVAGGLTAGTVYYVRDSATDRFKLSATNGGAAINLTSSAPMLVSDISGADFTGGAGQLEIASGDIVIEGWG